MANSSPQGKAIYGHGMAGFQSAHQSSHQSSHKPHVAQSSQSTPAYSMSKNVLVIDTAGPRMEPLQGLLDKFQQTSAEAVGIANIARSERMNTGDIYQEIQMNSVCSPASFHIVDNDQFSSPIEGLIPTAGQMMDYLLSKFKRDPKMQHQNPEKFGNWILKLCQDFTEIIKHDPVYLQLRSPVYVLGDIHGNFADLVYYMNQLVPFGNLKYCANQFLFLGDYVDRGAFGLEVVSLLFAMKCISPGSVWLLRGNHELFTINGDQQGYGDGSFKTQCMKRFGNKIGDDVWVAVNEAFKLLPLAASVDGKIFCAHGGIPHYNGQIPDRRIALLSDPNFPRFNSTHPQANDTPIRKLYREIAMDLLWSDPSDDETGLDEYGFGPNARGQNTYTFGNKAIEHFLATFGFEFVVRAHELKQDGLRISKHAKVLTVFTSSGYCGGDNGSGAVFVGNGRVRMISCLHTPNQNHAFAPLSELTSPAPVGKPIGKRGAGKPAPAFFNSVAGGGGGGSHANFHSRSAGEGITPREGATSPTARRASPQRSPSPRVAGGRPPSPHK